MLYAAHARALTQLAVLLVDDVAVAEETVQGAFVAIHGAWRRLGGSDKALPYLRRAVVRRARSARAAHPGRPSHWSAPPSTGLPASAPPQAALMALRSLPPRQREALVLRYHTGLPDAQIALAIGGGARSVNRHIERGMASLQARLGAAR